MTGGFGADYTFEATGNVAVMRQAVEAARMGWGLCTVCGVAGKGETLDVVPRLLITGRRVCGSSFGGLKGREDVPALIGRYLAGEIDVEPFISHRMPLDEVNRGLRADGGPGRHPLGARALRACRTEAGEGPLSDFFGFGWVGVAGAPAIMVAARSFEINMAGISWGRLESCLDAGARG